MSTVQLKDTANLEEFLATIAGLKSIRLVKLQDYGFTAPREKDGVVVIQPLVRIIVTAFDRPSNTIHRWQETAEASISLQTAVEGSRDKGTGVVMERDRVRERLQLEGFGVERGEWTQAGIEAILGRTGT